MPAELVIFARFRSIATQEAAALRETASRVRQEAGCLFTRAHRSGRDSRLFCLHSRWADEAAFDIHAGLPATRQFIERVQRLIEHPLDLTRTEALQQREP
jgi:quinol monooxygenase YgiN